MLDAALLAIDLVRDKTRADLDKDISLTLALVKTIEIVGEAAGRISAECRSSHPAIPWLDIIGMRHRLIHAYFDINSDIVWETVTDDLPQLVTELEKALSED